MRDNILKLITTFVIAYILIESFNYISVDKIEKIQIGSEIDTVYFEDTIRQYEIYY